VKISVDEFNQNEGLLFTCIVSDSNSWKMKKNAVFTRYQVFIIAILALLQFTIVLDFIVISPLGAQLLKALNLSTADFGLVVSVYAFSAGVSGIAAAGFADRFDRKKLLLFFYAGFILGTLLCGIADSYRFLLMARIVTGLFGGVISSVSFAIITDLFRMEHRGRVMGFVQMAFSSSQVLGIPVGLFLANKLGWHSPFIMITCASLVAGIVIMIKMRPINAHLGIQSDISAFGHLFKTVLQVKYFGAFSANMLLVTGGYMLMPFGSAFAVYNLGVSMQHLPVLYMVTGAFSMMAGPLIGKLSDTYGKYKIFLAGSILLSVLFLIYCNLGITPLWIVIAFNIFIMIAVLARIISASALMTAIPEKSDRGAFMSVNSSVQQVSGGIGAMIAGSIVMQSDQGKLLHYNTLGYVVITGVVITIVTMYFINRILEKNNRIPDTREKATEDVFSLAKVNREIA
jgi:predicted MFS family arabinose efflux permease